jgi:dihydroxycyclohexadiene carboxylate dehydrogenase
MAKSHHDKIAIVSGGANGIGQAFAQRLAQEGAHIVIAPCRPKRTGAIGQSSP